MTLSARETYSEAHPSPYVIYEREKQKLLDLIPDPQEYELALLNLVKALEI